MKSFLLLFPKAQFDRPLPTIEEAQPSYDDALFTLVSGWMHHLGPVTAEKLGAWLGLPSSEIDKALLRMEASGTILRGKFTSEEIRAGSPQQTEWCERRLLARIHRLTVATL